MQISVSEKYKIYYINLINAVISHNEAIEYVAIYYTLPTF